MYEYLKKCGGGGEISLNLWPFIFLSFFFDLLNSNILFLSLAHRATKSLQEEGGFCRISLTVSHLHRHHPATCGISLKCCVTMRAMRSSGQVYFSTQTTQYEFLFCRVRIVYETISATHWSVALMTPRTLMFPYKTFQIEMSLLYLFIYLFAFLYCPIAKALWVVHTR